MTQKSGKVVVSGDEWTLSDVGFRNAPDARAFVQNVASWFTGGKPGKFLAFSSNFGVTQGSFQNALKEAGHTLTINLSAKFTVEELLKYDGVFLAANAADNNVLIDYVKSGGCVYLAAGTGAGGSATNESNLWKPFLNAVGLKLEPMWDGFGGNAAPSQQHAIFTGVKQLYFNNSNPVSDIDPESPANQVGLKSPQGRGLVAWFDAALAPQSVHITDILFDGKVKSVESDEFIEIANQGFSHADISDWAVHAGHKGQDFTFPKGTILRSGQSIRIYTNETHADSGGFSFGSKRAIWNNAADEGTLRDSSGQKISSRSYKAEEPAAKPQS